MNDLPVRAEFSEEQITGVYLPLLRRLTALQREKGRRILAMLAAAPGSGKTTLSLFLERLSQGREDILPLQAIGMDGFHRYNSYLQTHETVRDGRVIPLYKIKGAPETFDLEKLTLYIRRLQKEPVLYWPAFSRRTHDPVEDAVRVSGSVVLLEGNYLLLDAPGWRELKQYADFTIWLSADRERLAGRLTDRKQASGFSREAAVEHVRYSDLRNVDLCMAKRLRADLEL